MTFDDVRAIALAWPEVQDGTSYGTSALKVRKKLLARIKEDDDSLVMLGVPQEERAMLCDSEPRVFYFTGSLSRLSDRADPPVESQARACRAVAAPALARVGVEGGGEEI
jgi:hypothetical protein